MEELVSEVDNLNSEKLYFGFSCQKDKPAMPKQLIGIPSSTKGCMELHSVKPAMAASPKGSQVNHNVKAALLPKTPERKYTIPEGVRGITKC